MMEISADRLAELKASNIGYAKPTDMTDNPEFITDPTIIEYLKNYAAPKEDGDGKLRPGQPCIACDKTHSFIWGLVHGQGHCTNCGWPATLYHFVHDAEGTEVAVIRGVLLWAHPDGVELTKQE